MHPIVKRFRDSWEISILKGIYWKPLLVACNIQAIRPHCMTNHHATMGGECLSKPFPWSTVWCCIQKYVVKLYHTRRKPPISGGQKDFGHMLYSWLTWIFGKLPLIQGHHKQLYCCVFMYAFFSQPGYGKIFFTWKIIILNLPSNETENVTEIMTLYDRDSFFKMLFHFVSHFQYSYSQ